MLKLHEAAKIMDRRMGRDRPVPFAIVYLTHDEKKRTRSGQVRRLVRATVPKGNAQFLLKLQRESGQRATIDVQPQGLTHLVRIHFDLILTINNQSIA